MEDTTVKRLSIKKHSNRIDERYYDDDDLNDTARPLTLFSNFKIPLIIFLCFNRSK